MSYDWGHLADKGSHLPDHFGRAVILGASVFLNFHRSLDQGGGGHGGGVVLSLSGGGDPLLHPGHGPHHLLLLSERVEGGGGGGDHQDLVVTPAQVS